MNKNSWSNMEVLVGTKVLFLQLIQSSNIPRNVYNIVLKIVIIYFLHKGAGITFLNSFVRSKVKFL